jgi:hypothetical protein
VRLAEAWKKAEKGGEKVGEFPEGNHLAGAFGGGGA